MTQLLNDDLHAAYLKAATARDRAREKYRAAEVAMWDAEREWEAAEKAEQRAYVALANGEIAQERKDG